MKHMTLRIRDMLCVEMFLAAAGVPEDSIMYAVQSGGVFMIVASDRKKLLEGDRSQFIGQVGFGVTPLAPDAFLKRVLASKDEFQEADAETRLCLYKSSVACNMDTEPLVRIAAMYLFKLEGRDVGTGGLVN